MNPTNELSGTKPVIGLVGGVGAGKSTAAAAFAELGCAVINGDAMGSAVIGEPEVLRELQDRWGERVLDNDGNIDRERLASVVFSDPAELAALNRITAPRIRKRIEEQIGRLHRDEDIPAIVVDAAILFEAGWDDLCTHVLFISAPDDQRADRTAKLRGWDDRTWTRREKSQISLDIKARRCYRTLDNNSSVSHLREQVQRALRQIVQRNAH